MSFSQGCLFLEAYEVSGTKEVGNTQGGGTPINYISGGTTTWSGASAKLFKQNGSNFNVPSAVLLPVFPLSGSGTSGTVSIDKAKLLALSSTNFNKVWEAFTANGWLQFLQSTSQGIKPIRVELRALKSANYSLTVSSRSAFPSYPGGCGNPNFNFTGESASNFTAQFQVPEQATVNTASFAPDDFSTPSGNLPPAGSYPSSLLALTRAFSTDSGGNSVPTYTVPSSLPSTLQVT
jgi:hypothetical protein